MRNRVLLLAVVCLLNSCHGADDRKSERVRVEPSPENISFLTIVQDSEAERADLRLKAFLEAQIPASPEGVHHQSRLQQDKMEYGEMIRAFVDRDSATGYLARMTPYVYVTAVMLGAKIDILATYRSVATRSTIYHSYFVVQKDSFDHFQGRKSSSSDSNQVTLDDLKAYLAKLAGKPARFIYHDRFSTSSYFLPSLYFKDNHIFATLQAMGTSLIPIQVEKFGATSSDLITEVASGRADLAAVWDGTRDKFRDAAPGSPRRAQYAKVRFFPAIPIDLPNDFLVASGVSQATEDRIVTGLRKNPWAGRQCSSLGRSVVSTRGETRIEPCDSAKDLTEKERPHDDFDSWYPWEDSEQAVLDQAREALAKLRQNARQPPFPVVVEIDSIASGDSSRDLALAGYVEAAREAVRLSGTEFVLYDPDLHRHSDMTWTLQSIHDGALRLTSTLPPRFGKSDEAFTLSFTDRNDLPRRIADLARSRLRRIRYVWPYEEKYPAVLRDIDFTPDTAVLVQKVTWLDPGTNSYVGDAPFHASITNATDFNKFRLTDDVHFPRSGGDLAFEPMSNVAYRVIIAREARPGWIWRALPYCFVGLFSLALIGLVIDLRRRQPPPRGLQQTYRQMVEAYHQPWREHELDDGEVLWSDPAGLDEFVKALKADGSFLDVVRSGGLDFNLGPFPFRFSVLMKLGTLITNGTQYPGELIEATGVGSVPALDRLIRFLVNSGRLSPFIGFPETDNAGDSTPAHLLEWDALNRIAARHFQDLGTSPKPVEVDLAAQTGALSTVVSSHFLEVMKKGKHEASLFRQVWTIQGNGNGEPAPRLVWQGRMSGVLQVNGGREKASRLQVDVMVPARSKVAADPAGSGRLPAWVLGRIHDWSIENDVLLVQVKPIAILRDHAAQ